MGQMRRGPPKGPRPVEAPAMYPQAPNADSPPRTKADVDKMRRDGWPDPPPQSAIEFMDALLEPAHVAENGDAYRYNPTEALMKRAEKLERRAVQLERRAEKLEKRVEGMRRAEVRAFWRIAGHIVAYAALMWLLYEWGVLPWSMLP